MKSYIGKGIQNKGGYLVAMVTEVDVKNGFGFANYMGRPVRFEARFGYAIEPGTGLLPEFTDRCAPVPKVGHSIIAFVMEGRNYLLAEAWGSYEQYVEAKAELKKATEKQVVQPVLTAAQAPKVPVVPLVGAPVPKPTVAQASRAINQQQLRRTPRVLQKPDAKPLPVDGPLSLEEAITGGYRLVGDPIVQVDEGASSRGEVVAEKSVSQA